MSYGYTITITYDYVFIATIFWMNNQILQIQSNVMRGTRVNNPIVVKVLTIIIGIICLGFIEIGGRLEQ